MDKSYLLCGVGGQGTVLASKLIAYAAMKKGLAVQTSETIGMAQRGGSVVSHVRVGDKSYSPMIPLHCADVILGFEPGEAVRCLPYLKEGGTVIVNTKAVQPVTASLSETTYDASVMNSYLKDKTVNPIMVDAEAICEACGSSKVLNIVLLAAAAGSGQLLITADELKSAIKERVAEKFWELNMKAIDLTLSQIQN